MEARRYSFLWWRKKELIGGFVIRTGDREYDRSILGRYKSLRQKLVMR